MPQAKKSEEDEHRSVLNPRDVMVITRERLQDTLDDAVRRGRMTRDDASDLLSELLRRAISPADRVMREGGPGARSRGEGWPRRGYERPPCAPHALLRRQPRAPHPRRRRAL